MFSGTLYRVALVRADVSVEHIVSNFRVTRLQYSQPAARKCLAMDGEENLLHDTPNVEFIRYREVVADWLLLHRLCLEWPLHRGCYCSHGQSCFVLLKDSDQTAAPGATQFHIPDPCSHSVASNINEYQQIFRKVLLGGKQNAAGEPPNRQLQSD
jgi:hypothetical protein